MKLYTKEQVRKMLKVCRDTDFYENILTFEDIFKTETAIELPSDEEIENLIGDGMQNYYKGIFEEGAKWMRDKIEGGNNEP